MEIKTDEIYAMRLSNGQEIVASIEYIDDEYYHMSSPLTIGQGAGGQMEFMPALFCGAAGEPAAMLKTSVDLLTRARPDIIEVYKESIKPESKVIMPGKKQILTG